MNDFDSSAPATSDPFDPFTFALQPTASKRRQSSFGIDYENEKAIKCRLKEGECCELDTTNESRICHSDQQMIVRHPRPLLPFPLAATITQMTLLSRYSLRLAHEGCRHLLQTLDKGSEWSLLLSHQACLRSLDLLHYLYSGPIRAEQDPDEVHFVNLVQFGLELGWQSLKGWKSWLWALIYRFHDGSFLTLEEGLRVFDGIFGLTETSHALASVVSLLLRELVRAPGEPDFQSLSFVSIIKAMLAYSILQRQTRQQWSDKYLSSSPILYSTETAPSDPLDGRQEKSLLLMEAQLQAFLLYRSSSSRSNNQKQEQQQDTEEEEEEEATEHENVKEDSPFSSYWRPETVPRSGSYSQASLPNVDDPSALDLKQLQRWNRFALAAYGRRFMRLFGIANYSKPLAKDCIDQFGRRHHPNHVSFAQHTSVDLSCVLESSSARTPPMDERLHHQNSGCTVQQHVLHQPNYYLTVDHRSRQIVVTVRGTFGLSDLLTNFACEYTHLQVGSHLFSVHAGMLTQAQALAQPSGRLGRAVREALVFWPQYQLLLVGHSLGAGIASLLGLLWSCVVEGEARTQETSGMPAGRRVNVFAFGTPCVGCLRLSAYMQSFVTTVVYGWDGVCALSLGSVRDWRAISVTLSQPADFNILKDQNEKSSTKGKTWSDVVLQEAFKTQRQSRDSVNSTKPRLTLAEWNPSEQSKEWMWVLRQHVQQQMVHEKLYPPGKVFWIRQDSEVKDNGEPTNVKSNSGRNRRLQVVRVDPEHVQHVFGEMQLRKSMLVDHVPMKYEEALQALIQSGS